MILRQATATSTIILLLTDDSPARLEPISVSGNGCNFLREELISYTEV